jgi:serine/alanine adding enzyme
MIRLLNLNEIKDEQWTNLFISSPNASCFQTKACYDFYAELSFLNPFLFAVSENDKLVGLACGYLIADGGVVQRFFSRRAIIPGGLLLDNNISQQALTALLEALRKGLSKEAIYIEIRNYTDYSAYKHDLIQNSFEYFSHLNIHVSTPDVSSAFDQLSASKKRQIVQTEKQGITCYLSNSQDDIIVFYEILKQLYKQKVKKPLFPVGFFNIILSHEFSRFFVVKKNDQVIGGILCVASDKVLYEWFVCGEEYPGKKIYPSVMATWKAIEYAASNGYAYFDFMGAGKPDEDYGVRTFKTKFGGKVVEQGRFLYLCKPWLYRFSKSILQIIRRIKFQ